jgi:hypothetical protein
MKLAAFLIAAGLLAGTATAQDFLGGTVYQVMADGVYLNTPNGITFMPSSASFRIGNAPVALPNLMPGTQLNCYYPHGYVPQFVPQDYYQQHQNIPWGQQVKAYQMEKNAWKHGGGKPGKGKGKWK